MAGPLASQCQRPAHDAIDPGGRIERLQAAAGHRTAAANPELGRIAAAVPGAGNSVMSTRGRTTQQRGIALITAMLIVALAAVIGAGLLTQMNLALHRSGYIWHSEQAWWYVIGIENWLGEMLQLDAEHTNIDSLEERWAQPVDYLPL